MVETSKRQSVRLLQAELRAARRRVAALEAELLHTRQAAVTLATWGADAHRARTEGRAA